MVTVIRSILDMIRLFHLASIALWMFVWYKNVRRNPNQMKAELFFASTQQDKATLLKEDKCISSSTFSNNINTINQRKPWQYGVYLITVLVSLTTLWITYTLRFDECNAIFEDN